VKKISPIENLKHREDEKSEMRCLGLLAVIVLLVARKSMAQTTMPSDVIPQWPNGAPGFEN
jgi:hypothetical protein